MRTGRNIKLALLMAATMMGGVNGLAWGQSSGSSAAAFSPQATPHLPHLVRFDSIIKDLSGKGMTGIVGVTFSLYKDQEGGAALWMETQSVELDASGHYSALLGETKSDGLPTDLFAAGETRWLGVTPERQPEQPRVLIVSVPYAFKALDAETLGGRPASAYALATPQAANATTPAQSGGNLAPAAGPPVTGSGTKNFLPIWTGTNLLGNSTLFQLGGNVGIGTTTPATMLDVHGSSTIRGNQTIIGTLNTTGAVTALSGAFTGNNAFSIVHVTQSGTGNGLLASTAGTSGSVAAINGMSTATKGLGRGVIGTSLSDNGGVGVFGIAGTFGGPGNSTGVTGSALDANGTGVSGNGSIGVFGEGFKVGGLFKLVETSGMILQGENSAGQTLFSVDGTGKLFSRTSMSTEGPLMSASVFTGAVSAFSVSVQGANIGTFIGDPGCNVGYAGIGFGGLSGCTNYSMIGNGKDTFLNRPLNGALHFRENNGEQVTIVPGGAVGIGTGTPNAKLDVRGGAGNSGLGISTDSNAWQARGAGGWVKAMAFVDPFASGGIAVTRCYNSQMTGAAITTPPCGMSINHLAQGLNLVDFGFEVSDRFILTTSAGAAVTNPNYDFCFGGNANEVCLGTFKTDDLSSVDVPFAIFIF